MALIDEYHRYHGAALALIAEHDGFTSINKLVEFDKRSVYVINHDRALYVKHATGTDGPWRFTFSVEHQNDVRRLYGRFGEHLFVVLVCGDEICALTFGEYGACVGLDCAGVEWLEVQRPPRGGFRVRGAHGGVNHVVRLNRFPDVVF